MRQGLLVPVVAGIFTMVGYVQPIHHGGLRTPKERFALELKACGDAYAAGKPSACQLFGRIQFVSSFPDVKVQVVSSFPDIKVQRVQDFPDKPGKWQEVTSFPDYKVQIVNSFPDYKIQYVTSFPGCQ